MSILKSIIMAILLPVLLFSCGTTSWYSIQQTPAESFAYLRDGVVMVGDYIRVATISEIDGEPVIMREKNLIKLSTGIHMIKIHCDEAVGKFNSKDFIGKAKVLELNAKIQRSYIAHCKPYTHWWIEDTENGNIVAGEKFI